MKKVYIPFCIVVLVLGFLGNANAISITDKTPLWRILTGTGSTSWTHDTPFDFEVPHDTVNSASIEVFANFVDGNNDKISIEGQFHGYLSNSHLVWSGGWNFDYVGTIIDIDPSFFNPWSNGDKLDVKLSYIETEGFKSLLLKKSVFRLDYDNNTGPPTVPVPEPETMLMLGFVLLGLVAVSRKRFKTSNK